MTAVTDSARMVADAFGLARPTGPFTEWAHTSHRTWSLQTADGRVLVKQVDCAGWREQFARAMEFEGRARAAGIDLPRPVPPVRPAFGYVTEVSGFGMLRAYEWVPGRAPTAEDDLAEWLGTTLATLHRVHPLPAAEPEVYGLHDRARWQRWRDEGARRGRPWAPLLAHRLPLLLAESERIRQGFEAAGGYVLTHRDVEPWNVLVTDDGAPVLVDWDTAGPDCAGLEAGHTAYAFAALGRQVPDPVVGRRILAAYARHGGRLPAADALLLRRAGMMLSRLAERLNVSVGWQESGPWDVAELDRTACARLERLPAFLAHLDDWARKLDDRPIRAGEGGDSR
ncbi:phosphotransferase [Plantactinospora sp. WMMC1484]|uniref:phosphotransferase n=1 Tax=Plantactinospora sp. WMMC1484 TaxID=3404122 RepID=UPI003BF55AD7